jgi:hypothetical protein
VYLSHHVEDRQAAQVAHALHRENDVVRRTEDAARDPTPAPMYIMQKEEGSYAGCVRMTPTPLVSGRFSSHAAVSPC